MTQPLLLRIRNALTNVKKADGRDIVTSGALTGLNVADNGRVRFAIEIAENEHAEASALIEAAQNAAGAVDGVSAVSAVATAHNAGKTAANTGAAARPGPPAGGGHDNPLGLKRAPAAPKDLLTGVKQVIAVASGKGGVGKSTIAANLAVAFAAKGLKTGFLDADIYGPSAPTLFGLSGKASMDDGKLQPMMAHGVCVMSIGFLVDPEQALAWRGPMVMGALRQLMRDVDWGDLDVLIIDTPPGTGDAHLSLVQSKRLSGAVIISTPQEMALADVRRGIELFRKTQVPVLGVIENMAWLENASGDKQYLFGEGGAQKAAQSLEAPFLGAVPLIPELRIASDQGQPLAAGDHPLAAYFSALADEIKAKLNR